MATVVLDSGNLEAVLADATGEVVETPATDDKVVEKDAKKADEAKATGADDDHTDAEDVEGDDGLTPKQKKELSATMLKTIGKKHRQMKEAEEFAAAQYSERRLAEARAETLQRELEAAKGQKQAEAEVKEPVKPARENFATEAEYVEALTDFKVDQKLAMRDAKQAQEASERAQAELLATAASRIAKALELVPDFKEVTQSADMIVPPAVAGYMQKSEMFAELGYHLAKHPELVVSLAKLPMDEQLVKIGKIESTLQPFSEGFTSSSNDAKSSKAVTEAKQASDITGTVLSKARNTAPVIKPLSVNGAAVEKDPAEMNIRETIADWQKHNSVNLAIRKRH